MSVEKDSEGRDFVAQIAPAGEPKEHGRAVPKDAKTPPHVRYVLFSDARGVYLGGGTWSYDLKPGEGNFTAPTFGKEGAHKEAEQIGEGCRPCEVHGVAAHGRATAENCLSSGLTGGW